MKSKSFSSLAFSTIGVAALALLLIGLNYVTSFAKQRFDLTSDHSFTLSDGTRHILSQLDTPVTIRFYVSQGAEVPSGLKEYAHEVEDLLGEYQQLNPKFISVRKLDPQPDSDAEDSANLDGIEAQQGRAGDKLYLGLSVSMLDQKQVIPLLDPRRERQLEYDITRAISNVMTAEKPVVAILTPLPVKGMGGSPDLGEQPRPPWVFYTELQRTFTVRVLDYATTEIPADVKVLVVIHPKSLKPATEFAIDQFVMRGGKLVAFLDPLSFIDVQQESSMGEYMPTSNSTFDHLFEAWGIKFDVDKCVADMTYGAEVRDGRQPAVLVLNANAFNKDDIVTADLDNVVLPFVGAFSSASTAGLQLTPLITSSKEAEMVDNNQVQMAPQQVGAQFRATGITYPLAIRLTGTFRTAFPAGRPSEPTSGPQAPPSLNPPLTRTAQPNTVILFGDSDFIQDTVAVSEMQNPFGGQTPIIVPANGNLNLAESAVEQMAGNDDLIALRGRGVLERPFTVVRGLQEKAEDAYRDKIQQLELKEHDTESKLAELQKTKTDGQGQKFILSPEEQQEIANYRQVKADVVKQLKDVRRSLRADIDSLETRLEWFNIALMPALVAVVGIVAGLVKRQHAGAR